MTELTTKENLKKITQVPATAKLALAGACFFWAASFIATKTALANVPPLTLVMLRLIVSSLCFLVWMAVTGKKIPMPHAGSWSRLFLLSLFGTGLHYSIQTIGMQYTTASNSSIYVVTGPITITLIAAVFLGERITLKKALGILCALIGVLTVMGYETIINFDLKGHLLGDLLVFTSIFMWGIFTVLGKDMTARMSAVDLTAIVTFMGTLYMLPTGLWEMQAKGFSINEIHMNSWASIAFLGIACSFLSVLLYVFALQKMESQKVGVYLYTIPPMTCIIAAIFLNEAISLSIVIGTIIVIAGVYITERG